jgi:hypothetical protein
MLDDLQEPAARKIVAVVEGVREGAHGGGLGVMLRRRPTASRTPAKCFTDSHQDQPITGFRPILTGACDITSFVRIPQHNARFPPLRTTIFL